MTTRNLINVTATALALVALSGCTMAPVIRAPAPVGYANRPPTQGADPFPKWPVSPGEAERLLLHSRYERVGETGAGAGTTGAEKVTLSFPDDGVVTNVKWKRVDPNWKLFTERYDGINNSPRKEIAASKRPRDRGKSTV